MNNERIWLLIIYPITHIILMLFCLSEAFSCEEVCSYTGSSAIIPNICWLVFELPLRLLDGLSLSSNVGIFIFYLLPFLIGFILLILLNTIKNCYKYPKA